MSAHSSAGRYVASRQPCSPNEDINAHTGAPDRAMVRADHQETAPSGEGNPPYVGQTPSQPPAARLFEARTRCLTTHAATAARLPTLSRCRLYLLVQCVLVATAAAQHAPQPAPVTLPSCRSA